VSRARCNALVALVALLPCYSASMDILRRATVPPGKVKVGQRVTVRLYIRAHRAPLEVQVALSPRARGDADALDPANLYLSQIGCRRSDR
jgi:hypothetical protein